MWSTDITYIKIAGGMVYLAAIIDWYSKAVFSWRISNTTDADLVMGVLKKANILAIFILKRLNIIVLQYQWMVKVKLLIISV